MRAQGAGFGSGGNGWILTDAGDPKHMQVAPSWFFYHCFWARFAGFWPKNACILLVGHQANPKLGTKGVQNPPRSCTTCLAHPPKQLVVFGWARDPLVAIGTAQPPTPP